MERNGWRWFLSRKQAFFGTLVSASQARDVLALLVDRHWPAVCSCGVNVGEFVSMMLMQWKDCVLRGFWSLIRMESVALFVMAWSCFISFNSVSSVVYVLLGLGAAGAAICLLGYTPGLFIVGLFGILVLWVYGNIWVTGMLLIVGGYIFSFNHARILILMSTVYAVYHVNARVGWVGVFLSLNLSFLSNDFLNKLLQGYDGAGSTVFENQKEPEQLVEDFCEDTKYFSPTNEAENVVASNSSCKMSSTSNVLKAQNQKDAACSKVVEADLTSLDEIRRIMDSSNHYEALGFPGKRNIDPELLKREYRARARLVHPDKNMGSTLASESFKKLQSAYEVLSNFSKKRIYDEQLRKEECKVDLQKSHATPQQEGVDYRAEESRRIECTKCNNSHIWICTSRSKGRARWCKDCSQYHQAKDGDGWVEYGRPFVFSTPRKVEIPRAFVCAESKIFDVSEWAICQGMACRANTHCPSFHVNMVGLEKTTSHRSNSLRYPWGLDAQMMPDDDEFDLRLRQALASSLFSDGPKRRKSWSPFKIHQRGMNPWRRSP